MQVAIRLNRSHYDVTVTGERIQYFGKDLGVVGKSEGKWRAENADGDTFTAGTRKDCLRWLLNGHIFPGTPLPHRIP